MKRSSWVIGRNPNPIVSVLIKDCTEEKTDTQISDIKTK